MRNDCNSKILITRPTQQNVSTSLYTKSHLIQFSSAPSMIVGSTLMSFPSFSCVSFSRRCNNGSMYFSKFNVCQNGFKNYLIFFFSSLLDRKIAAQFLSLGSFLNRLLLSSLVCVWAGLHITANEHQKL